MTVGTADHGDRLEARGDRIGLYVGGYPNGSWCELPWQPGHVWTAPETKAYAATRAKVPFGARDWFQGEVVNVTIDGTAWTIRLYGVPFKKDGPSTNPQGQQNPNIAAVLEFYKPSSATVVKTWPLGDLGRDTSGAPIGGRLEPEGLAVAVLNGQRVLLVGIAVGTIGNTYMQVYARPI